MEKFTTLQSTAAPFPDINVDTDIIIPKQFLKTVKRTGLGQYAFYDKRYDSQGHKIDTFILNRPEYQNAQILIVGDNFGCGSSREHAVWAITDMGIKAIIAPSFADIFSTNATKNGLLLIRLPLETIEHITDLTINRPDLSFTVDLAKQTIAFADKELHFDIDPFVRHCFLNGLDEIALTLEKEDKISTYENRIRQEKPWLIR